MAASLLQSTRCMHLSPTLGNAWTRTRLGFGASHFVPTLSTCFSTISVRPPHLGRNHGSRAGKKKFPREGEPVRPKRVERSQDLAEVSTRLKEIRVSPWTLNLVSKAVRGLTVVDAMANMQFCKKKHSVTMMRIINNACNLASMRYKLQPEQLCIGEVFVTKGKFEKRLRFMARGRVGIASRKWSHLNLTLREIDFNALYKAATTPRGRRKVLERKLEVEKIVQTKSNSQ